MDGNISVKYADISAAKLSRFGNKSLRHQFMGSQKVADFVWIKRHDFIVCFVSVFDLFDIFLQTCDNFALNNGGNFSKRQRISLDGEGRVNRPQAVFSM